jgi:hypothetical protein
MDRRLGGPHRGGLDDLEKRKFLALPWLQIRPWVVQLLIIPKNKRFTGQPSIDQSNQEILWTLRFQVEVARRWRRHSNVSKVEYGGGKYAWGELGTTLKHGRNFGSLLPVIIHFAATEFFFFSSWAGNTRFEYPSGYIPLSCFSLVVISVTMWIKGKQDLLHSATMSWHLWFLQRWVRIVLPSGIWYHAVWEQTTNITEKPGDSIFYH